MITIFAALILGFLLSKLVAFPQRTQALIGKLSSFAILLLLFTMGLTIGADSEVMSNLPRLGLKALLIAAVTVVGSTLAVWITLRLFKTKHTVPNGGEVD
ncbi:MAG: lysine exporter LysO family protein [Firmicutes bacterium]|nr:lysine exporter LysO family protein [Bacillota bacterium]